MNDQHLDPYNNREQVFARQLHTTTDINDAQRVAAVSSQFNITPNKPSDLRDILGVDGSYLDSTSESAYLSYNDDTYIISTDETAFRSVDFETVPVGQYRSGTESIAGIYVQKDDPPVGVAEWGYGRMAQTVETVSVGENGLYFRYESDGTLSFVVERAGVETVIPQSEWGPENNGKNGPREYTDENGDVSGMLYSFDDLNDSGESGLTLDVADGYVYRIDFAWYGGGAICPKIVTLGREGRQRSWAPFIFKPLGQTSFAKPNQPVFCRLDNNGTATADSIRVAGRQVSTVGDFKDSTRETTHLHDQANLPGSNTTLFAFRRKPGFEGVELGIGRAETFLSGGRVFIGLVVNPNLGGQTPDWQVPSGKNTGDETAIEVAELDDTGSDLTADLATGERYNGKLAVAGSGTGSLTQRGPITFPVPRNQPVVFYARSLGTGNPDIDLNVVFNETW